MLQFDLPKDQASIIKVIGVGGGGSNAVNHMHGQGIVGVNFVVCNTDEQALEHSVVPNKIHLGPEITKGLGAGSEPEIGRKATEESAQMVKDILNKKTEMVFITAGMGGGTGTGGAPVVAKIAREMGILTVGIVTTPFSFEGQRKIKQAIEGINMLRQYVDTIIVISNDKIREIYGNLKQREAFSHADNILTIAARSISEIITNPGIINIDFADVKYVMKDGGTAIMGTGAAEGEDRAYKATNMALTSPLLNDNDIKGAEKVLINISSSREYEVTMDEIDEITNIVRDAASKDLDVIFGTCDDEEMGETLSVTIIATGFQHSIIQKEKAAATKTEQKRVFKLEEEKEVVNQNFDFVSKQNDSEINLFNPIAAVTEISNNIIEFEINHTEPMQEIVEQEEFTIFTKDISSEAVIEESVNVAETFVAKENRDEEIEDRQKILRDLSYKFDNPSVLKQYEDVPAYMRKNIDLADNIPSDKSEQSRYNLGIDEDGNPTLGRNTFLHDNVD
jgi:cell division protein FtsZ